MLKIEDVKVGDELVCIDREGMLCNERLPEAWREYMYKQDKFIVNSIYKNCIVYLDGLKMQITAINGIEKYFKKKEQSQQYTFDDLIDYAVQAFKDGKLFSVGITVCGVSARLPDKQSEILFINTEVKRGVEYIQSLYKEAFVIESEEDIKRIIKGARITLTNDNLLTAKNTYYIVEDHIVIDAYTDECTTCQNLNYNIGIVFLKGATVEQERGRDD